MMVTSLTTVTMQGDRRYSYYLEVATTEVLGLFGIEGFVIVVTGG